MDRNNSAPTAPFVRDPAAGPTFNVLGVTHIYKATALRRRVVFALGGCGSTGCWRTAAHARR